MFSLISTVKICKFQSFHNELLEVRDKESFNDLLHYIFLFSVLFVVVI